MKKIIGITGSIASGKTYAMEMFKKICEEKKIKVVFLNVDDIRRGILEKENIDRNVLNSKIYNDKKEMQKYKEFINPKIRKYLLEQINNNDCLIFIEWALLVEDYLYDLVDSIILIYCTKNIQLKRLENTDLSKQEIVKRINLQLTNDEKLERIKNLNKNYYVIDTSKNPKINEYKEILKKEGLYE